MLVEISKEIDQRLTEGGANVRKTFDARVKSLMTDVPDLPNFSHFHEAFRKDAGRRTNEGDIRGGFYTAYDALGCEYIRLADPEIDRQLKRGLTSFPRISSFRTLRVSRSWCPVR